MPVRHEVLRGAPRRRSAPGLVPVLLLAAGCTSHGELIRPFREAYSAGDFPRAEEEIDHLISKESGVPVDVVSSSRGLDETIDPSEDDVALLLLERAMASLALGDPDASIDLLRRSRDALEPRYTSKDVVGWFQAVLKDDTSIDFTGSDYEHIALRTILTVCDLLTGGEDAFAYALQIDEKQEQILGSTFGEGLEGRGGRRVSYNPREAFQRLAIGAYLQGVVQEAKLFPDEAAKAYARAEDWSGGVEVARRAFQETSGEVRPPPGTGVLHVIYLGGSGPYLVSGRGEVTDLALALAQVGAVIADGALGLLTQAPVPVPVVVTPSPAVPPLVVRTDGVEDRGQVLLDVNQVARQEVDANMPWIVARAVVRRAFKAVVSKKAADQVKDEDASLLLELGANLLLTVGEKADVRSWTSLPAQVQVLRLRLPEGEHWLDMGGAGGVQVRTRAGRSSFVVAVQPNLRVPAAILVDPASRAAAAP